MNKKPDKDEIINEGKDFVQPIIRSELDNANQHLTVAGIGASASGLAALQGFLDTLPAAVYSCEAPSGIITFYNEYAVRLWGRTPNLGDTDERFCGSFRLWSPDGNPLPHNQTPMALALREGHSFRSEEVVIERPDGTRINVLVNIDPIYDANGRVTGAINAFHDISERKRAERALKAKEAELELIAETTPLILTRCSRDLCYLFANRAAAALFNLTPDELIGRPLIEVMGEEAFSIIKPRIEQVLRGEPVEFETKMPYPGGGPRWVRVNYLPEWDRHGTVVGWVASIVDITERKKAEEALQQLTETLEERVEQRTQQVRQLASELVTAEQSVRQNIAHLLHDDLQQMLFAVEIQLGFLRDDVGAKDELDEVIETVRQALGLTRQLAVELSPPVLEGSGLQETLSWLAQHMTDVYQLQVTVEASGHLPTASEEQRILLYQNVRELLFNVVKHAGVQEAQVAVQVREDGFAVTVSDHGRGFDVAELVGRGNGRFGLHSVHERLKLFGGRADIDSQPGAGTRVTLFLPHVPPSDERMGRRMRP